VWVEVGDSYGCTGTDTIYVGACKAKELFKDMMNVFTPNGDGVNDTWFVRNLDLYPNAKIEVFDRWGRLVFHKNGGYENDWTGKWKGNPLPMDSYYYIIDLKNGEEPLQGTVTIVR
jgi:gliding motility-associated-like protein